MVPCDTSHRGCFFFIGKIGWVGSGAPKKADHSSSRLSDVLAAVIIARWFERDAHMRCQHATQFIEMRHCWAKDCCWRSSHVVVRLGELDTIGKAKDGVQRQSIV